MALGILEKVPILSKKYVLGLQWWEVINKLREAGIIYYIRPENSTVHHILQKVPEDNLFIKTIWNLLVEKKIKNFEKLCECLYKNIINLMLKITHIYSITVSIGLESRHGLTVSSASESQSKCQPGSIPSWGSGFPSKLA